MHCMPKRFEQQYLFQHDLFNAEDSNSSLTETKVHEIEGKLANFFFQTEISLRLVESKAFKDLIGSLNPACVPTMPSANKLSGTLLNQQYEQSMER